MQQEGKLLSITRNAAMNSKCSVFAYYTARFEECMDTKLSHLKFSHLSKHKTQTKLFPSTKCLKLSLCDLINIQI
jgi:hypothetical protein